MFDFFDIINKTLQWRVYILRRVLMNEHQQRHFKIIHGKVERIQFTMKSFGQLRNLF